MLKLLRIEVVPWNSQWAISIRRGTASLMLSARTFKSHHDAARVARNLIDSIKLGDWTFLDMGERRKSK